MAQSTMTGETTIGIDLGDRKSHICVLSSESEVLERAEVPIEANPSIDPFVTRNSRRQ